MKVNLHAHTTLSDGKNKPIEMIKAYRDMGYGAIALTDHRFDAVPYYYPMVKGITVFGGVEVTRHVHWLMIVGDFELLRILAHPQRHFKRLHQVTRLDFDLVECTDHAIPVQIDGNWVFKTGLRTVATDDAHSISEIGGAWIDVDLANVRGAITPKDRIIRAIKMGNYHLRGI